MSVDANSSNAEKLRDFAGWFDVVDELIGHIEVTVKATGEVRDLVDYLDDVHEGSSTEIQDWLRELADWFEANEP